MQAGAQGVFYGSGLPLLLSPPQQWCLISPVGVDLLPCSLCLWLSTPQPLVYHFPHPWCTAPRLLGCLHTSNTSPLPGNDLWSLSLITQPPPKLLRLWCLRQWFRWSVLLSLCFLVLRPAVVLSSASWKSLQLCYISVGWLGGFPGCGLPFSFTAASQECLPILDSFSLFFFFYSTQSCQEFLTLFGDLSSASIQFMSSASCFTCRCGLFFMCLWERVSVSSYSSATLPLSAKAL